MFGLILSFLTGGPLQRILDTVDKHVDAGVKRDEIRAKAISDFTSAQVAAINGGNPADKWIMLGVAVPTLTHYAAVCFYSVFWCKGCMAPVAWTIAALPPPFDQWEGAVVMSFFVGATGMGLMKQFKN